MLNDIAENSGVGSQAPVNGPPAGMRDGLSMLICIPHSTAQTCLAFGVINLPLGSGPRSNGICGAANTIHGAQSPSYAEFWNLASDLLPAACYILLTTALATVSLRPMMRNDGRSSAMRTTMPAPMP